MLVQCESPSTENLSCSLSLDQLSLLLDGLDDCVLELESFLLVVLKSIVGKAFHMNLRMSPILVSKDDARECNSFMDWIVAAVLVGLVQNEVPHNAADLTPNPKPQTPTSNPSESNLLV